MEIKHKMTTINQTSSSDNELNKSDFLSLLPVDACLRIITFCRPNDVPTLAATSRYFYKLCNLDIVWKLILQSYNCNVPVSHLHLFPKSPYLHYFQNYFYHLTPLQGLWLIHISPYNILLRIHSSPTPYILEASFCSCPLLDKFSNEISLFSVATLRMGNTNQSEKSSNQAEHSCITYLVKKLETIWNTFNGSSTEFYLHSESSKSNNNIIFEIDTVKIENNMNLDVYYTERIGMLKGRAAKRPLQVSKIRIPNIVTPQLQILLPGIYKGSYAGHGIELVLVYYEVNKIIVKKLTGDPNVPGDKISLNCSFNAEAFDYPIQLDLEKYMHEVEGIPAKYIACYKGKGQIAYDGFLYPDFCPGCMYVADANTFIFAWDGFMQQISLYSRCGNLSNFAMQ